MRAYYEEPDESELPAVKTQRKLALSCLICVILLLGCAHLWTEGVPTRAVAVVFFVLLCISIVLYTISVLGYGFVAMSGYVVRDGYGILRFLFVMIVVLFVGIFAIVMMFN